MIDTLLLGEKMIEISNVQIIVMFFLCILAGFIDSVAGGGGLVSLTSYYAIGLPPVYALGNNKFSSTFGTLFATLNYARKGTVVYRIAIFASVFALIGSAIGAHLALLFAGHIFRYVLLFVLPVLTVFTLRKPTLKMERKELDIKAGFSYRIYIFVFLISSVVGVYDGFFGPGTGMFYTLGLSFIGMPIVYSCGTTKLINLASNIAALTTFIANGNIIYKLGIPCIFASIIGNLFGSEFAIKKGDKGIKPIIIVVIVLLYIKIIADLVI